MHFNNILLDHDEFFVPLATLCSMWDLSCLIRAQTCAPCSGSLKILTTGLQVLNYFKKCLWNGLVINQVDLLLIIPVVGSWQPLPSATLPLPDSSCGQSPAWVPRFCLLSGPPRWPKPVTMVLSLGSSWFKNGMWDFPGGPVAKTLGSQCRGPGFDPWMGS